MAHAPRVYERRKADGTIVYDVKADYTDPLTGQRRQKTHTCSNKREARKWLAQFQADAARGLAVPRDTRTLGVWLDEWLAIHEPHVKPTTIREYRNTVHNHITPFIGHVPLQDVTPARIQRHYSDLLANGRSKRTVHEVHVRLDQALDQARRLRLIPTNPTADVEAPTYTPPRRQIWTDDERATFLRSIVGTTHEPIWRLALHTGLRHGEMCGLRWVDVDMERGVIHVQQSITYRSNERFVQTPKSGRSRLVLVDHDIVDMLTAHKARQNQLRLRHGLLWQDHGLVFCTRYGTPIYANDLRKYFNDACKRAGVPHITIHDLRHAHASMLVEAGIEMPLVSERLGHADVSVTQNIYAHVQPRRHKEIADLVGDMLRTTSQPSG